MKVEKLIPQFLKQQKSIPWILIVVVIGVSMQKYLLGPHYYNNYIIFKTSFSHLIHYQNLYLEYPNEYNDLFLYTPTFAFLMFPFAYLPMVLQVILWCGLIGFTGYFAIKMLPFNEERKRVWLVWLILFEFITAMQNMQAAGIVASCVIMGFSCLERRQVYKGAFFIMLAAFIKIYALGAIVLFLLYPNRIKSIAAVLFWGLVLWALPLLVISFKQLSFLYQSWYNLTANIHQSQEVGINVNILRPLSVMNWLKSWFNLFLPILYVQLAGTAILCLPFLRYKLYSNLKFRLLLLSSFLIWAMIFNHIAESPSYIVAVFGVAIWFVAEDKNWPTISLMVIAFVFTTLESTDIFPGYIRTKFFDPYVIKAVPCIFIWFYIQYQLLFKRFQPYPALPSSLT